MEPLTTGTIALVTLLSEKIGEILLEKFLEQGGKKLIQRLKNHSSDTASAIEKAEQHPNLLEQKPEDVVFWVEKIEEAAKSDSQIAVAIQALAQKMESQAMFNSELYAKFQELINIVKSQRSASKTAPKYHKQTIYNNNNEKFADNLGAVIQGDAGNINMRDMNIGGKS